MYEQGTGNKENQSFYVQTFAIMVSFTSVFTLGLFALAATASPIENIEKRAAATCGSNYYTADQVNQAAQKSCSYYSAGTTAGSSTYPHTYKYVCSFVTYALTY